MENAGFWKRTTSFVLDLLIINIIIGYPFSTLFSKMTFLDIASVETLPNELYFAMLMVSILALLYFTFFEYYLGQSPGQMFYKIRVVSTKNLTHNDFKKTSKKQNTESISFAQSLLRNCFILPFFPFYIFWIMEPFYLGFYKERFLERISRTKTVIENSTSKDSLKGIQLEKVK